MKTIDEQIENAEQAYKEMLDLMLNEIRQVVEKTPWIGREPDWWFDMKRIGRLVVKCKKNMGIK